MKTPVSIRMAAKLQLTAASGSGRKFSCTAYSGGLLRVDGFPLPVVVDLSKVDTPQTGTMPLLIGHDTSDTNKTLGQASSIVNTGEQTLIAGAITGISEDCQNILRMYDQGHDWQASIGGTVLDYEEVPAGRSVQVNGRSFNGPLIVATKFAWRETSIVPVGGDADTKVNLAAAAVMQGASPMPTFEEWVKQTYEMDAGVLSDAMKQKLMQEYAASIAPPATGSATPAAEPVMDAAADPMQDPNKMAAKAALDLQASLRHTAAKHYEYQAALEAKAAGFPQILQAAMKNNWSLDRVELEVLKAQQHSKAPAGHVRMANNSPRVLEAALCQKLRTPNHEKQYTDQELQAAHTQFRGGVRLQQLILLAAAETGFHVAPGMSITRSNYGEVMRHVAQYQGQSLTAAGSTLDIPGILSNVANKEIVAGYEADVGNLAWREIAAVKSVRDFKQVTTYRMLDDMEYEELPIGGQIKEGVLSEESYTRQVRTYAKMFRLDRVHIINDDLSALEDLRKRLGMGASKKLNAIFWKKFMSSLSMLFTAARGNYISGSTTNLGTDGVGLSLAVKAFRTMKTPAADGNKRINAQVGSTAGGRPEILLVGPSLESTADKLYVGSNLNVGTAAGEENIHRNKYRPVVAWQLEDSAYSGSSATQWFLLNNPNYLAAMVVSFLDGVETPTVESSESVFNTLGIDFRGYHDFGCDAAEYLAGVHSKGAA